MTLGLWGHAEGRDAGTGGSARYYVGEGFVAVAAWGEGSIGSRVEAGVVAFSLPWSPWSAEVQSRSEETGRWESGAEDIAHGEIVGAAHTRTTAG